MTTNGSERLTRRWEDRVHEVNAQNLSSDDLLEAIRSELRSIRLALPTYRSVQERARYAMTVEDLEEVEQLYTQFINDQAGVFEREDYVDALVRIRATGEVINYVLRNGSGQQGPAAAKSAGCMVFLAATSAAATTVVWLL